MGYDALLVPFGILEIGCGAQPIDQLWIGFGQSRETADFIADSLERWWEQRRTVHLGIKRIQINLDNGPEISSSRTSSTLSCSSTGGAEESTRVFTDMSF